MNRTQDRELKREETQNQFPYRDEETAEVEELNFDDSGPVGRIGDEVSEAERQHLERGSKEVGLTEAAVPDRQPTGDDLSPETLILEDGANSPNEAGYDRPADKTFRRVDGTDIGAGSGLDEAELARVDPLDGKPWNSASEEKGKTH